MNDVTPVPRDKQTPIAFRSDLAARLLAELTGDGRSEAQVIEQALTREADRSQSDLAVADDRETETRPKLTSEEFIARIDAIVRPLHGLPGPSFKEIDDAMWDENGLPI